MTDQAIFDALASHQRTTPVLELPAIPPAWLDDLSGTQLIALQRAVEDSAVPIISIQDRVAMTERLAPPPAPTPSTPIWQVREAAAVLDMPPPRSTTPETDLEPDPNAPPMLEIDVTDHPALLSWLKDHHAGWKVISRWFFLRSTMAHQAVLYVDTSLPNGTPVRFHLCFDLWAVQQRKAVAQIDRVHAIGLSAPALLHPEEQVIMQGKRYQRYTGIIIDVAVPFWEAIQQDPGYTDIRDDRAALWKRATRPDDPDIRLLDPAEPLYVDTWLRTHAMAVNAADRRGVGTLALFYDPRVFEPEAGDVLPRANVVGLTVWGADRSLGATRMDETVYERTFVDQIGRQKIYQQRPVTRRKPGWHSVSIVGAQQTIHGWMWVWELTVQYRKLRDETDQDAITRAVAAMTKGDYEEHEGALPPLFLPLLWLLATGGGDWARLFARLDFYAHLNRALDGTLLGWMELVEGVREIKKLRDARAGGDAEAELVARMRNEADMVGRLCMQTVQEVLAPVYQLGDISPIPRDERAWITLLLRLRERLWLGAPALGAILRLTLRWVGQDEQEGAMLSLAALATLLHPSSMVARPHPAMPQITHQGEPADERLRTVQATSWRWIQEILLNGGDVDEYHAPRLPADARAWLTNGDAWTLPVWAPILLLLNLTRMTEAEGDVLEAVIADFNARAAAGVRPVVGYYRPQIPTEGFPLLTRLGITELKVFMNGDGTGWCAFGPADAYGVVLPFIPLPGPLNPWRLVVPERLAWELALILNAWYADMRVAGEARVMQARRVIEHPAPAKSGKERSANGKPATLYVPRRQRVNTAPSTPGMQVTTGQYADADDRAEIRRRIEQAHGVRAHVWRRVGVTWKRRAIQQRAWDQLDAASRLQILFGHAGSTAKRTDLSYPAEGQIRGMQVTEREDGTLDIQLGYQRGGRHDRAEGTVVKARPVVCQSLHAARAALKLLADRQTGQPPDPIDNDGEIE